MNPEQRHLEEIQQRQEKMVKDSYAMSRIRYTHISRWNGQKHHKVRALDFKVYIQIWQDDDWDYDEFLNYCKKLTEEQVELNTTSYKAMADQLYLLIAKDMPSRNIWICINNDDIGITVKYER